MGQLTSDLSVSQYAAIGKVACEWAHVESTLRHYIQGVTGWSFERSCQVVGPITSSVMLWELVLSLLHSVEAGDDDAAQSRLYRRFKKLHGSFSDLRLERNRVVHRDWIRQKPGSAAAIELGARGREPKLVTRQVREMESLAARIGAFNNLLWELLLDEERERGLPGYPRK